MGEGIRSVSASFGDDETSGGVERKEAGISRSSGRDSISASSSRVRLCAVRPSVKMYGEREGAELTERLDDGCSVVSPKRSRRSPSSARKTGELSVLDASRFHTLAVMSGRAAGSYCLYREPLAVLLKNGEPNERKTVGESVKPRCEVFDSEF